MNLLSLEVKSVVGEAMTYPWIIFDFIYWFEMLASSPATQVVWPGAHTERGGQVATSPALVHGKKHEEY